VAFIYGRRRPVAAREDSDDDEMAGQP
jgi:hypothetical protein